MAKLYQWNKHGEVEVYEGQNSIIVGDDKYGYKVFASKRNIKGIHSNGDIDYKTYAGYLGNYKNKHEALVDFKQTDNALMSKSKGFLQIPIDSGKGFNKGYAVTISNGARATGGVLIYDPRYPETKIHELAHIKLGHLKVDPKDKRERISFEKDAIALEIDVLKKQGKYNQNVKRRIARSLRTHMKCDDKKALATVVSLE